MDGTFLEIGLVIGIATFVSLIVRFFKQPLIIAYIITGVIVGPSLFNLISSTDTITLFSHMGIALLLFLVGLSLDPKVIREVGLVSVITGAGQVVFTTVIGLLVAVALGFQ
ncbi:MAG: cation:proton antiporter, partial [Nanoarchaeota archaeon]